MKEKCSRPIPFSIESSVRRYLSYGWGNSIIVSLVRRRFGARMSSRCVEMLRNNTSCTPKCRENCVFRDRD